jgi:hypothetical protein
MDATWRAESMAVMFWALGQIPELNLPSEQCDPEPLAAMLSSGSLGEFIDGARLRSEAEILDALDFVSRFHTAVKDATVASREPPAGAQPGVIYQQHVALNWLTCYLNQEWDDVEADT